MVRETLTREQIVTTTIGILDAEGIEALSMRRLGQQLGSAATSMYWHVGSRQNLIALASDQIWSSIELPDIDASGWRAAALLLASGMDDVLTAHRWLAAATTGYFAYGPGMARFQDHSYAIYEAAGFEGTDLDWANSTVFSFVLGAALGEAYGADMRARLDEDHPGGLEDRLRMSEETAGEFPRLRARIEAQRGIDRDAARQESFAYGMETVLDGLQSRLER
jgi:AcrR family transcriptional regulator